MKAAVFVLSGLFAIATASPARAQLGDLGKLKKLGDKVADAKQKFDAVNITAAEERQLGDQVSLKLRSRFGVFQNEPITRYVSLVGTVLAQASTRPTLEWKFIVLDTDGVNAFAAPGGFIHVTRGLLGLMKSEAQLAGVLGHEITHVTAKHTVRAIQKNKGFENLTEAVGRSGVLNAAAIAKAADRVYDSVIEGEFSREDENESDRIGAQLASKVGYAPNGMAEILKMIDARNDGREDRNGLFASHPATTDRIRKLEQQIVAEKLTGKATAGARYKQHIPFDAKPASGIAMNVDGAAGLASGDKKKPDDPKAGDKKADDKKGEEPKKKGGFGSALGHITGNKQAQSGQQVASAGARGGLPDRDAKGGDNKNPVVVTITAAELEAFRKGIAA